jgi:hypothetical protein
MDRGNNMGGFYQPKPNSESLGYKPTDLDSLSDEEIVKLLNGTGRVKVAPQQKPKSNKYVDLDRIIDNG